MTWPQDGGARYVLVEISGNLEIGLGGSQRRWPDGVTCSILDRAVCFRQVWKQRTEDQRNARGYRMQHPEALAQVRERATAKLAELNEEALVVA